jgi:hypothetical protein
LAGADEAWKIRSEMRRPALMKPPLIPALLGALALTMIAGLTFLSCGGSKRGPNDEYWSNEQAQEAKPLRETEELTTTTAAPEPDASAEALLGVRHDLMIAPTVKREARCSCLAVAAGAASDPQFQWQSGAPDVGPGAMAIAVSARGVECPGGAPDESKRRASISAVDQLGADVAVEIEEVPEGRPIASGAIIPRPGPGGSLYVRGKNARVPYARSRPGEHGGCKIL